MSSEHHAESGAAVRCSAVLDAYETDKLYEKISKLSVASQIVRLLDHCRRLEDSDALCKAGREADEIMRPSRAICSWTLNDSMPNLFYWTTECDKCFELSHDDETQAAPSEFCFCPYCGGVIAKASNEKVSYHADNAGGAHEKDTNDK